MIVYNYKHLVSFKILAFKKYNLEKQCNIKFALITEPGLK